MNEGKQEQTRSKYTLEFKLEAVRLVNNGQAVSVTAKVLGIPNQTLDNWVRLNKKGQLTGATDKPVSVEQMELARLRAQLARVTMERDILKKATAAPAACAEPEKGREVRLDSQTQKDVAGHVNLRSAASQC